MKRSSAALGWSGLTAGLSMGFSLAAEGLLRTHLPGTPWSLLITKLGYTMGFFIVVLGRQQLYTETTLTAVIPWLHRKDARTAWHVGRLWMMVLATNLIGAALFAWATLATDAFGAEVRTAFTDIGVAAAQWGFWTAAVKGVYAGWLIALMVWLMPAAGSAKWIVVVALTYLVGLGELTHIVAGSVEVLYATMAGAVSWGHCIGLYMVPTLIGNTVGGVLLVAALNHAQAMGGNHEDHERGVTESRR